MSFVIEKTVPIPTQPARAAKYPLAEMEVGDSFALRIEDRETVRGAVSYFCKKSTRKFTVRKDGEGYRCWRVA